MEMPKVTDHWIDQHNAWKARRERLQADRAARKTHRDHGLRRRHATKLARNDRKAAISDESETAAYSVVGPV